MHIYLPQQSQTYNPIWDALSFLWDNFWPILLITVGISILLHLPIILGKDDD